MKIMKQRLIIQLAEAQKPLSSIQLAETVGISKSKLKLLIKELNPVLATHGALIEGKTGHGNGYRLVISDPGRFNAFMEDGMPGVLDTDFHVCASQRDRVDYLIKRFLESGTYLKADDLADELYISRSQFQKDLKQVKQELEGYGITIGNKPYSGLIACADESAVRQYLVKKEQEKMNGEQYSLICTEGEDANKKLKILREIVIANCQKFQYKLNDFTCQNLVTHLYIVLQRAAKDYLVEVSDALKQTVAQEPEYRLAESVIQDIRARFQIDLPDNEVYYCAIHLCGKKIAGENDLYSKDVSAWVTDILETIREIHGVDLTEDLDLNVRLTLHIIPLLSRIKYRLNLRNPLLPEIKRQYVQAYDLAITCATCINEKMGCRLSDNEVSYFAIHFQLSLSNLKLENRKRVLLVCSTGKGSAVLLKTKLLTKYSGSIQAIDTCDRLNIQNVDLDKYDIVFSTVPLPPIKRPVILISNFITPKDEEVIHNVLHGEKSIYEFISYFKRELFLPSICAGSKEEILRIMCDHVRRVKKVPEDFYDSVLARERLADTCYAENLALPHPQTILTDETFISIGILGKPVLWTEGKYVEMVFLCSFSKNFARENEPFFEMLTEILSSAKLIKKLSHALSYDEWVSALLDK